MRKLVLVMCLLFSLLVTLNAENKLPNIVILATGGTIAGTGSSATSSSYKAGSLAIDQILKSVPNLSNLANIKYEQVCNIPSQDMDNNTMIKLAKKVEYYLSQKDVDGVVITHGTDTMDETSYFLNLVINSDKPIVMTGSMRSSTELSADGPLNLYNAVAVAASKSAYEKGVLIVMNDSILGARDTSKGDTTNIDTFNVKNGLLGLVNAGNIKFYNISLMKHTTQSEFNIDDITSLPDVDIVYEHENGMMNLLNAVLSNKELKGIVVASVGDGNLYKDDISILEKARKRGVAVVMSTRVWQGRVLKSAEMDNNKLEFNTADTLSPAKARILLSLVLTKTNNYEEIQKYFDNY